MITNEECKKAIDEWEEREIKVIKEQARFMREMQKADKMGENATAQHIVPISFNQYYFKCTKPVALWIGSRRELLANCTWQNFIATALRIAVNEDAQCRENLLNWRDKLQGDSRLYVSKTEAGIARNKNARPVKVYKNIWVETNFDAQQACYQLVNSIFETIGFDYRTMQVEIIPTGVSPNAEVVGHGYIKGMLKAEKKSRRLLNMSGYQAALDDCTASECPS